MNASKTQAYTVAIVAGLIGTASLGLSCAFLVWGPLQLVASLDLSKAGTLVLDSILCLAFFIQHSTMVRRSFRKRLARVLPDYFHGAIYAIASGVALLTLVILWQESTHVLVELRGAARWLLRSLIPAAFILFAWGIIALRSFDTFGIHVILAQFRNKAEKQSPLAARGPYRWVRHPLYLAFLMLIWSYPTLTPDRLLLNVLFTAWVVMGTMWEERDLVAEFGDPYREYQYRVPMLIPWRISKK
jgi:protein-S-isoprenylcysteine O-methyltransferase Ste14